MSDVTMPDLSIERDLLATHDFAAMHDRLDRSIRRAFAIRVATVAALIAIVATLLFAFTRSPSSSNAPIVRATSRPHTRSGARRQRRS